MTPLIVFSHLRWDFVYQRPQHLLSRLARRRPVLFVEEPVPRSPRNWLEQQTPVEGVRVLRPHVTGAADGFADEHVPTLRRMVSTVLRELAIDDYLVWFYTPMALPLADGLEPRGLIYDCMDELSAFRFAPPQLVQREARLLREADLVLTGGPSLYASKRALRPDVHCFPSSVDARHFGQQLHEHPSQFPLPHPRLGYYGVIDERLDLKLIAALADAHDDWQVVMIGPVVKIDPASLPRRDNLYWLGKRDYAELPAHLVGWDVCLMPFALNEATRFISPTKTLEYLAAGRPCVSTPVHDVVELYSGAVSIADGTRNFVRACEQILRWTGADRARFRQRAQEIVEHSSWDLTVASIERLLERFDKPVELAVGADMDPDVDLEFDAEVDATVGADASAGTETAVALAAPPVASN
ncbi:MAG TPA: glycosyltransferase [Burkholderiaceae bacterium]|nr:glycosyltransferase [Burkholderiaceae bacterium]